MAKQSLNLPYFLLAGTVLVAIIMIFTVFRPQWQTLQDTREQVAARAAKLDERQAFLASINGKRAILNQQQQHEQQLDIILPRDESLDDMTRLLHRAAESTGVIVAGIANISDAEQSAVRARTVRNQPTNFPPGVLPLGFTVEIRGTYQQLRAFFDALDRFVRLADVRSLELQRDVAQPDQIITKLTVRFYQHDKVVPSPVPSPQSNAQ